MEVKREKSDTDVTAEISINSIENDFQNIKFIIYGEIIHSCKVTQKEKIDDIK